MKLSRILSLIFTTLVWLVFAVVLISLGGMAFNNAKAYFGLGRVPVPVEGTGSMYPSLFWDKSQGGPDNSSQAAIEEYRTSPRMYRYPPGIKIGNISLFSKDLVYGDMVTFHNTRTKEILESEGADGEAGFIKRVVGLPGDTITLRDGFLIRNGETVEEPYIYKPRSTYGGPTLPDCNQLTVPDNHVFVLGDNRKVSHDSRHEVGLIPISDISFFLPFNQQQEYRVLWRDASGDGELANQPTLNKTAFYKLLNEQRAKLGLKPLAFSTQLERSSALRAEVILKTNDFSTEATRSGYTMSDALADTGYSNILTGEVLTLGFYDAQELFNNLMNAPGTKSTLVNSRYQDVGFAAVEREVNGCPTQAIVGHLGGYVPPNYDTEAVESWGQLVANLDEAIPTWESLRGKPGAINQTQLNNLLELMYRRRNAAADIYNTMKANRWLSEFQQQQIDQDEALGNQINSLIEEIYKQ